MNTPARVETLSFVVDGFEVVAVLDHATAQDIYRLATGQPAPWPPAGTNTVILPFEYEGRAALYWCQHSFTPTAADNEQQLNGAGVLYATVKPPPPHLHGTLEAFVAVLLAATPPTP